MNGRASAAPKKLGATRAPWTEVPASSILSSYVAVVNEPAGGVLNVGNRSHPDVAAMLPNIAARSSPRLNTPTFPTGLTRGLSRPYFSPCTCFDHAATSGWIGPLVAAYAFAHFAMLVRSAASVAGCGALRCRM